jgi:hypothetical protein
LHSDYTPTHERNFEIKFVSFLDLLPEFDSNLMEFGFGIIRVWLNHMINALIKSLMKMIKDFVTRGVTTLPP